MAAGSKPITHTHQVTVEITTDRTQMDRVIRKVIGSGNDESQALHNACQNLATERNWGFVHSVHYCSDYRTGSFFLQTVGDAHGFSYERLSSPK